MQETTQLTLVGTPIGNLSDMSARGIEALREADVIAAEDTRVTRKLLTHFGITGKKLITVAAHDEAGGTQRVVMELEAGRFVALVSDAGMPGVADPGAAVVRAATEAGYLVTAVPGPTAIAMAVALSGMMGDRFVFEGFLPASGAVRAQRLKSIGDEERTTILYEAPHRTVNTICDLSAVTLGSRQIVIMRELTKKFEEVWRGSLSQAVEHMTTTISRGEYVVVLAGATKMGVDENSILNALRIEIADGASIKSAVVSVAEALNAPRNIVYKLALDNFRPKPNPTIDA